MAEPTRTVSNQFQPTKIQEVLERFDNLDAQEETLREQLREDLSDLASDRKALLEEAQAKHGLGKKAMKHLLKWRKARAKLEGFDRGVDGDVISDVQAMRDAIGFETTPLGKFIGDAKGE